MRRGGGSGSFAESATARSSGCGSRERPTR